MMHKKYFITALSVVLLVVIVTLPQTVRSHPESECGKLPEELKQASEQINDFHMLEGSDITITLCTAPLVHHFKGVKYSITSYDAIPNVEQYQSFLSEILVDMCDSYEEFCPYPEQLVFVFNTDDGFKLNLNQGEWNHIKVLSDEYYRAAENMPKKGESLGVLTPPHRDSGELLILGVNGELSGAASDPPLIHHAFFDPYNNNCQKIFEDLELSVGPGFKVVRFKRQAIRPWVLDVSDPEQIGGTFRMNVVPYKLPEFSKVPVGEVPLAPQEKLEKTMTIKERLLAPFKSDEQE